MNITDSENTEPEPINMVEWPYTIRDLITFYEERAEYPGDEEFRARISCMLNATDFLYTSMLLQQRIERRASIQDTQDIITLIHFYQEHSAHRAYPRQFETLYDNSVARYIINNSLRTKSQCIRLKRLSETFSYKETSGSLCIRNRLEHQDYPGPLFFWLYVLPASVHMYHDLLMYHLCNIDCTHPRLLSLVHHYDVIHHIGTIF